MLLKLTCRHCGANGLHACTGRPIPPPTPEQRERLLAVLRKAAESENHLPEHLRGKTMAGCDA